jgi:ABC-type phosphate/phosphonate transport system substrate-binding protein/outer membrane protein assembly factor BamB
MMSRGTPANRLGIGSAIACFAAFLGGQAAVFHPAIGKEGDGPEQIVIVVMDPLAAQLSCPCVKGYAQRDYEALAAHLTQSVGCPVHLGFGESLAAGLKAAKADRADLVIGKDSVVRADAAQAGAPLVASWALTDAHGSIETRGLFVVAADDPAESLDEIIDYAVYVGRPDHAEKHARALDALRAAGLPDPFDTHEFGSCSDAAATMLEAEQPAQIVAIVSAYAKPLLEGCGTVPRDALRVIGETEPVRFITAFVDETLDLATRDAIRDALRTVAEDDALLKKLESSRGFIPLAADEGWTGWRGPERTGVANWLPDHLPENPAIVWSRPLTRSGLGGIAATRAWVVFGDRDDADEQDVFRCFDADTGDAIWEVAYDAPGDLDYGNSPRATPLIHNNRAILLGAMGDLHCVELATGETAWKRHLVRDFAVPKAAVSAWGYCYSPIIADDRLIVSPGAPDAAVVALDPATGAELWRTPGRPAGFGSFVAAVFGGRRQVIGFDAESLGGWEVGTGRRIWEWRPPVGGGFNVPTPVLLPGKPARVLISNETDGTLLFTMNHDGSLPAEPSASSGDLSAEMATPVVVGRHVIGIQDRLVALDAGDTLQTQATLEEPSLATYAAVIAGAASFLTIGNGGRLALYDIADGGCRLNSMTTVLPASQESDTRCPVYSHPAIVGTRLYIRGNNDLVCVDLASPAESN